MVEDSPLMVAMVAIGSPWWENFAVGVEVILCRLYVELVLNDSIEKRVGRAFARVGKSTTNHLTSFAATMHAATIG